jgi:hypothetical protein
MFLQSRWLPDTAFIFIDRTIDPSRAVEVHLPQLRLKRSNFENAMTTKPCKIIRASSIGGVS